MNLNSILKKAWHMLWHYRALWLFGTVLALVGASAIIPPSWPDWQNNDQWTRIKLSEATTLKLPGADVTIDLTAPGGFRIITPDNFSWREFTDLVDMLEREASIDLRSILIEMVVLLGSLFLLGLLARYVTETALIRMVHESGETGKYLSVWQGLRKGFSIRACRLFLLDLLVGVLSILLFSAVLGLPMIPFLFSKGRDGVFLNIIELSTWVFIVLGILFWLVVRAVLSMVLQPLRRACVLEKQGLLASIIHGIKLTLHHFTEIAPLWLIWMGIRLIWVPFMVPVMILFVPFLLLTIPLGTALGGAPAAFVAAIAYGFMDGATPWILGIIAGLPIFILVVISPLLFLSGLVEVYLSSIWTLGYRDMNAMDQNVQEPIIETQALAAPSKA